MVKPTEAEVLQLYEQDSAFFVFNGITPKLDLMREQHHSLVRLYEQLGIKVHEVRWADDPPRSAYGPMKRGISAAAGFVINGGAIIPREATPYWPAAACGTGADGALCPILYTVHGRACGSAPRCARRRFIVRCSRPTATVRCQQVILLQRSGYKRVLLSASPAALRLHEEVPGWMHADMSHAPRCEACADLSAWCDYQTIRDLQRSATLIEAPRDG
jgi:hypothetical protein